MTNWSWWDVIFIMSLSHILHAFMHAESLKSCHYFHNPSPTIPFTSLVHCPLTSKPTGISPHLWSYQVHPLMIPSSFWCLLTFQAPRIPSLSQTLLPFWAPVDPISIWYLHITISEISWKEQKHLHIYKFKYKQEICSKCKRTQLCKHIC